MTLLRDFLNMAIPTYSTKRQAFAQLPKKFLERTTLSLSTFFLQGQHLKLLKDFFRSSIKQEYIRSSTAAPISVELKLLSQTKHCCQNIPLQRKIGLLLPKPMF